MHANKLGSVTRIWPSTPFIRDEDPYIRISVGVDPDEVEPVARAICNGLDRHYRVSRSAMAQWRLKENGVEKSNSVATETRENGFVNENGVVLANKNYFESV